MPCNSEYMNPNHAEQNSRHMAQLLCYVLPLMGAKPPVWVATAARYIYGNTQRIDELTQMLCTTCNEMTKEEQDAIIYNGRDTKARALADWFDEHKEADAKREREEAAAKALAKTKAKALAKLTPKERKALGL